MRTESDFSRSVIGIFLFFSCKFCPFFKLNAIKQVEGKKGH